MRSNKHFKLPVLVKYISQLPWKKFCFCWPLRPLRKAFANLKKSLCWQNFAGLWPVRSALFYQSRFFESPGLFISTLSQRGLQHFGTLWNTSGVQWWTSADLLFLIKNKVCGIVSTKKNFRFSQSMLFTDC